MRKVALSVLAVVLCASAALADSRAEYRAFWVDTFNTSLNNHADVVAVVNKAKAVFRAVEMACKAPDWL